MWRAFAHYSLGLMTSLFSTPMPLSSELVLCSQWREWERNNLWPTSLSEWPLRKETTLFPNLNAWQWSKRWTTLLFIWLAVNSLSSPTTKLCWLYRSLLDWQADWCDGHWLCKYSSLNLSTGRASYIKTQMDCHDNILHQNADGLSWQCWPEDEELMRSAEEIPLSSLPVDVSLRDDKPILRGGPSAGGGRPAAQEGEMLRADPST